MPEEKFSLHRSKIAKMLIIVCDSQTVFTNFSMKRQPDDAEDLLSRTMLSASMLSESLS